ncbi:MAG: hypothetical protein II577_02145 [Erysipelotrichaceae bacterium]|nr:hypothetical protein [Erysipelotrichaceae bacterium]
MKVIKSINNNIAHCLDAKGREVVVFGKGIGFYRPDQDTPLDRINRTFYNIKDSDYVDADDEGNGTYDRYRKDSFYWYKKVIATNGEDLED